MKVSSPFKLHPLAGSISLPSILKTQRPGRLTLVVSSMLAMSGVLEPGMLKKLVLFPPLKPAYETKKGQTWLAKHKNKPIMVDVASSQPASDSTFY